MSTVNNGPQIVRSGLVLDLDASYMRSYSPNVYPNPTDNEFTISFSSNNTTHQIELFDVTGKIIFKDSTDQSQFKMKKNEMASGLYFLKVSSKNGAVTTQKVVLK